MAARVNKRFIAILVVVVGVVVVGVGGLWYVQRKADVQRHLVAGDAAMVEQDYRKAASAYGRAVHKQPGNIEYLTKMRGALEMIRPDTPEEARNEYNRLLALLDRVAAHRPEDAEAHLIYIRELYRCGRISTAPQWWDRLGTAADDMYARVAPGDPEFPLSLLYRGIAQMEQARRLGDETFHSADEDLRAYLEKQPDSGLAWGTLIKGYYFRAIGESSPRRRDEVMLEVDRLLDEAQANGADGVQFAVAAAYRLVDRRAHEDPDVSRQHVTDAGAELVARAAVSEDPLDLVDIAEMVVLLDPGASTQELCDLIIAYVAEHPDALQHRLMLTRLQYLTGQLDDAIDSAEAVIDSKPMRVSFIGQAQYDFRRQAVLLVCDVRYRQWELAEDKDAAIAPLEAARATLLTYCPEPATNSDLARVDGSVALAKGDYAEAANRFEQYLRPGGEFAMPHALVLSAVALEQIGQIGVAYERVKEAVAKQPIDPYLWHALARLEFTMGRNEDCARSLDRLEQIKEDYPGLRSMRLALNARLAGVGGATDDAVVIAVEAAGADLRAGRHDDARATLIPLHQQNPESVELLLALYKIEFDADDRDAARGYLDQALALAPNNLRLLAADATMATDDPIERSRLFFTAIEEDVDRRTILFGISLANRAVSHDIAAATFDAEGDADAAEAARADAVRARTESAALLAEARAATPEHPVLIDYEFTVAEGVGDWDLAAAIADRAAAADVDGVDGLTFKARVAIGRGDYEAARGLLDGAIQQQRYRAYPWRLRALTHERLGRSDDALLDYGEAYKCNPNDIRTIRPYVGLLVRMGRGSEALPILRLAESGLATNDDLTLAYLSLEERVGILQKAIDRRRRIYDRRPDDISTSEGHLANAMRLASLLGTRRPGREDILDDGGQPKYDLPRWARMNKDAQQKALDNDHPDNPGQRQKWIAESEEIIATILDATPEADQFQIVQFHAALLRQRGARDDGRALIERHIALHATDETRAGMLVGLGQYLQQTGNTDEAMTTLKEAVAAQTGDDRIGDLALGNLYAGLSQYDRALPHYEAVVDAGNQDPMVFGLFIETLTMLGQYDEATTRLDEHVASRGETTLTMMLAAAIAEGRGTKAWTAGDRDAAAGYFDECLSILTDAAAADRRSAIPLIQEGRFRLAEFGRTGDADALDQALSVLSAAELIEAENLDLRLLRTAVFQAQQDTAGAIGELTRCVRMVPLNQPLRQQLIAMHMSQQDYAAAVGLATEATELFPNTAAWFEGLGELQLRSNNLEDAGASLQQAYDLEPNDSILMKLTGVLIELADRESRSSRPNDREVARLYGQAMTLLESSGVMDTDPMARAVYACAVFGRDQRSQALSEMDASYRELKRRIRDGDADSTVIRQWLRLLTRMFTRPADAEEFLMRLSDRSPSDMELRWLAGMWALSGPDGVSHAVELQNQAMAMSATAEPSVRAEMFNELGTYYNALPDYDAALRAFSEVIRLRPEDPGALNNYAFVLGDRLGRAEEAIPYAEKALSLLPDDPNLLDTMGSLRLQVGDVDEALRLLRRAVERRPTAGTYVTLARAQIEKKEYERARTSLRRAEELRPTSRLKEEIARLAADIENK